MKVASGQLPRVSIMQRKMLLKTFKLALLNNKHWLRSGQAQALPSRTYRGKLSLTPQWKFKPFHYLWLLIFFNWLGHLLAQMHKFTVLNSRAYYLRF